MTLVQNIVFRLIGLYIFIAPKHGAKFMADVVVRTNREVAAKQREKDGRSLAA